MSAPLPKKRALRQSILKWCAVLLYLTGAYYVGHIALHDAVRRNQAGHGGYSEDADGVGKLVLEQSELSAREVWRTTRDGDECLDILVLVGEPEETIFRTVYTSEEDARMILSIGESGRLAYYTNENGYVDLTLMSIADEDRGYTYYDLDSDGNLDVVCERSGPDSLPTGKLRRGNKWVDAVFNDARREWVAQDKPESTPKE